MHYKLFSREKQQWLIVVCWLIVAVACAFYLPRTENPFKIEDVNDPKAESSVAQKIMKNEFPFGGSSIFVLYRSTDSLSANDSQFEREVKKSLDGLSKFEFEHRILSPYNNSRQISDNKKLAYAVILTNAKSEQLANAFDGIRKDLGHPEHLRIYLGGEPAYTADVNRLSEENLVRGEMIALPICFIAMIFIFSGFLAAMLTIFVGVVNILIIVSILYLMGERVDLSVFVLNIATMLGLGLGLDYTLLITYRFREEYAKCHDTRKTILITLGTAGKSVFFSGMIVLVCIASLVFFPINILFSIGVGGVVVVLVTILSSVTFLPALLCLFQKYVTRSSPKLQHISSEDVHHHRWYRFAMLVMQYPFTFMIPSIVILVMLGMPFLQVKINISDEKILPAWSESRKVVDLFNANFDPNELAPVNVVLTAKNKSILSRANVGALYDFTRKIKKDKGVKRVNSIVNFKEGMTKAQYQQMYQTKPLPFNDEDKKSFEGMAKGKYTVVSVISKYPKDDDRTFELVKRLRAMTIGNSISVNVGGHTAEIIDTMKVVYSMFTKVVIFISIFTYIILCMLLRSLFLPLKAIVMNLLSLSVCFGMLVFIFQEGHLAGLLHFTALGFTDLNLPILLFFVLFGISMDYEVFLLTRIKEYYERTHDNTKSVAMGLERSARIITSAALIMVIVTGAFVTADIVFIKAFGLGSALAIAIDATVIRLMLVPSTMRLLGSWNWYLPKWLDRILPDLHFDKESICFLPEKKSKSGKS